MSGLREGCSLRDSRMEMEPDDMPMTLPHVGTWYFADPAGTIPVPPDARLVLNAEGGFTLAMGDEMGTEFTLFMTPGITKFEVSGTYMIGADESASFSLPDNPASAVSVEPPASLAAIGPALVTALAAIPADDTSWS